jgi:hypothetical protein
MLFSTFVDYGTVITYYPSMPLHGQENVRCSENAVHSYSPGTNIETSAFMNEKFHSGSISEKIFHKATRGEYQERVRQQNHRLDERSCVVVVVVDIKCWPHC